MQDLRVLMYHATYRDAAELAAIDVADRPYAVSLDGFRQQLDAMQAAGYVFAPGDTLGEWDDGQAPVLLTFDDGHLSNADQVTPLLAERGIGGLFFVTTDFCRERPDYCNAEALRRMRAAGMSLGTHGCSHRFLADLSAEESRRELADAKAWLEDVLGEAVLSVSFPGGRYGERELALAAELGYRAVHTSDFGLARAAAGRVPAVLPRIPVRQAHTAEQVLALMDPHSAAHRQVKRSTAIKSLVKRVIGNKAYDALYRTLAA